MKYTIETDDKEEHKVMLDAMMYRSAFEDVWNDCFRPATKYSCYGSVVKDHKELNELLKDERVYRAIELVGEIYQSINRELE